MIQQMQRQCHACGGQGKSFTTKSEREVLEVQIQKGSVNDHKEKFTEMADERPDHDTGDVVFVLKQQEHALFRRKGADLFVDREISLVEALCGFTMELTHLDGRKLLIKTAPGDIIKPMSSGFDPFADSEGKTEWEAMEGFDCPDIDNVAQADTTDIDTLKKACDTQLKRKGIDVGVFVVDSNRAYFKQGTREEILAAKKPRKGCTMYVISDPNAKAHLRMMKAVKGEGMPTFKNPFQHGNLFLILKIQFPDTLDEKTQEAMKKLLPPPLNVPSISMDDKDVEVHNVTDMDPVLSYNSNKINMNTGAEGAYDEDEEGGGGGGGGPQCKQM